MLIQLVSFQPPLPSYVSCSQANCPDEKFKILMTSTPNNSTPNNGLLLYCLYLEGGQRVTLHDGAETAGCWWSTDPHTGFQGPGSRLGKAEEPSSCPDPPPLCSLSIRFTYSGCGTQAEKSHFRHLATAGKKKMQKAPDSSQRTVPPVLLFVLFFFFFLGCLSTARLYFMPSVSAAVFCCGFLTWTVMSCSPVCRLL